MKKHLKTILLTFAAWLTVSSVVLAAFTSTLLVTNTSSIAYPMLAANVTTNIEFMAANGYFSGDEGLDTRVLLGLAAQPHMLADDRLMFAIPVPATSSQSLQFTTGSSNVTSFEIITGFGGQIDTLDAANLEPGDNFTLSFSGFFDTDNGTAKNILIKEAALRLYVSDTVSGNVTADIIGLDSTPAVVAATNTSTETGAETTHNISLPASISSGDLLILNFGTQSGTVITTPSGWTELDNTLNSGIRFAIYYKIADGAEGATVDITTSVAKTSAHSTYRITGYDGVPEISAPVTAQSVNPNPPNLTASWGAAANLWLAVMGYQNGGAATSVSSYPSGYTDGLNPKMATSGNPGLGTANLTTNAASENPGTFTITDSSNWVAHTIVISPDFVPVASVSATGISSGEHTIITGIRDRADFADWAADASVSVSFGAGVLPVTILEEQVVTSAVTSITFSDIDALIAKWDTMAGVTSRHIVLMVNARSADGVDDRNLQLRFNGDSGPNYSYDFISGVSATFGNARTSSATFINILDAIPGTNYGADAYGGGIFLIPNATSTGNFTPVLYWGGGAENSVTVNSGQWRDVSAVTSIFLGVNSGNYGIGSTFQLGVIDDRYLIEEQILAANGNFDFSGIAADGGDLLLIGATRSSRVSSGGTAEITLNADTTATNYFGQYIRSVNGAGNSLIVNNNNWFNTAGNTNESFAFGGFWAYLPDYTDTGNFQSVYNLTGHASSGQSLVAVHTGRWINNAAINRVQITDVVTPFTHEPGSSVSLYRVPRTVIETVSPSGTNVTFSNIPQGFEALQIVIDGRSDFAGLTDNVTITVNGDSTASKYKVQRLNAVNTVVTADRDLATQIIATIPGASEGANEYGGGIITLNQYAATDKDKHIFTMDGPAGSGITIRSMRIEITDNISSITLAVENGSGFISGSVITLSGLMASRVFDIEVDGVVGGVAGIVGLSVPDNSNIWTFLQNNVMPYADNISLSVAGAAQLLYKPITIIIDIDGSSGNITDRQGANNWGTITWGGNPSGVNVVMGALITDFSVTAQDVTGTQDIVPDITAPNNPSDVARLANLAANDPVFYPLFSAFNTVSGISILVQYWMTFMILAIIAFFQMYKWTSNLLLSGIGFTTVIGFAVAWPTGGGIYDFWVVGLLAIFLTGMALLEGRQPS